MFLEVRTRFRKPVEVLGRKYVCHGCGAHSPLMKLGKLPKRWATRLELHYDARGIHRRGWVDNYYCPSCDGAGCNARTVARTELKLARQQRKGVSRGPRRL